MSNTKFSDGALLRLSRPVPGERQQGVSPLVFELARRSERKVLVPNPVEARKSRLDHKHREIMPSTRPEPYAPQLIRLVRHPYALATVHGRREAYRDGPTLIEPRAPTPKGMREAGEAMPKVGRERLTDVLERPVPLWRPWQLVYTAQESE